MYKCNNHTNLHFQRILEIQSILSNSPLTLQNTQITPIDYLHSKKLIIDKPTIYTHKRHEIEDWTQFQKDSNW